MVNQDVVDNWNSGAKNRVFGCVNAIYFREMKVTNTCSSGSGEHLHKGNGCTWCRQHVESRVIWEDRLK